MSVFSVKRASIAGASRELDELRKAPPPMPMSRVTMRAAKPPRLRLPVRETLPVAGSLPVPV